MQTIDLNTGGMHCGSCSMLIQMTVEDLPGVSSAKADYASGRTHVEFDSGEVSVDAIIAAIVGAGYGGARGLEWPPAAAPPPARPVRLSGVSHGCPR